MCANYSVVCISLKRINHLLSTFTHEEIQMQEFKVFLHCGIVTFTEVNDRSSSATTASTGSSQVNLNPDIHLICGSMLRTWLLIINVGHWHVYKTQKVKNFHAHTKWMAWSRRCFLEKSWIAEEQRKYGIIKKLTSLSWNTSLSWV